jgi:hypothetical protein
MSSNYAQKLINDLYEEGDRDFHFFNELLGFVANIYPEPYMKNRVDLNKSRDRQFEDALLLANFFIASGAYVGFYMKEYGKFDEIFDNAKAFENFVRRSANDDAHYFERITAEDRYTIGLKKIKSGAKAPQITSEIENIFS